MIPCRLIGAKPDEPAEQEIKLQPLHQLPLRAHGIKRLEQHCAQKHLGRDRWPTDPGIEHRKLARQRFQRLVHNRSDRSQRMVGANPLLQADVGEQLSRALVRASHSILSTTSTPSESCLCPPRHRLFQRPARRLAKQGRAQATDDVSSAQISEACLVEQMAG
jgi:hypothetical protein